MAKDTAKTTENNAAVSTAPKFKKVKNVTLPLLKLEDGRPYYLRLDTVPELGKVVDDDKEAPMIGEVTDMETGEQCQLIFGKVLLEELKRSYPENGFVGHIFEIEKKSPEGKRKYSLWNIAEVELN